MNLKEFFGFGGYLREAEGYMSWQHLVSVTVLVVAMIICAVLLGRKFKNRDDKSKNKVLIATAFLIDGFEIFKIIILSIRHGNPFYFVYVLPLFLGRVTAYLSVFLPVFGRTYNLFKCLKGGYFSLFKGLCRGASDHAPTSLIYCKISTFGVNY